MTDRPDDEGNTDPDPGESPFVGAPFVAQGEAMPGSPGTMAGPFRWVVLAQGFSSFAFWATFGTMFAEATNRFHATSSEMAVLGAALSVPFILGSLLQGLVVDRWSPKWTAVIGYSLQLTAVPVALAAPSLPWIWAAAFVIGGAFATIEPARSALTSLLVPEDQLVRANGTLATAFQLALVVGSLAGGWLLEAWNADAVYAAAAGAALLPVLCMLMVPDVRQHGERPSISLADLRRGTQTAWRHPTLRILLVVTVAGWTLVNVFFVLEPLFVRDVLMRQGNALLYLWGAHGLGSLAGAIAITRARDTAGHEARMVCAGVVLVGAGIVVYTAVGRYPVALVASAASGVGFALFFPPLLALIQRVIPEDQRGRVTSVFVALQETAGLASSLALLAFGGIVAVQPVLVASGAVLAAMGVMGLRAVARVSSEAVGERTSA